MKILCIGHSAYDITVPVDTFPLENKKYRLKKETESGGGPASNVAYLLGMWNEEVYYTGVIGNDVYGQRIKKELEIVKVDTHLVETTYKNDTQISLILINKQNGSRTVFNISDDYPTLSKHDVDLIPDIILTDGYDFIASKEVLDKYSKAISVLDAGYYSSEMLDLCKRVKYIVCSKEFAEEVTKTKFDFNNKKSLVEIYQLLADKYEDKVVVITLEENGALYSDNGIIKLMPALKVEAKDTTGAGDVFHGAFVYGLSKGVDIEKTIKYATIASGISVTRMGARQSVPTLKEAEEEYIKNN